MLSLGLRVRRSARGYVAGRLRAAARAGKPLAGLRILVHADEDAAGLAIAGLVLKRPGAPPWREVNADSGVQEESLLDELLADLRGGVRGDE